MGGTKYSVLIVDDQKNWRNLLTELLQKQFTVVAVASYKDAIQKILEAATPFHVVITDMRLEDNVPGNEDGVKLIEYLHNLGGQTKTILLTGYPSLATAKKTLMQLDAYDYLEKYPSDPVDSRFDQNVFLRIVTEAAVLAEKYRNRLVFMLMPFAEEYKAFYEIAIKQAIQGLGLECKRVDDFYQSRNIMGDIIKGIQNAKFILADLSGRNPNVFLEVGIAHATQKHVLLITQKLEDVPPKLQVVRCHIYRSTIEGKDEIAATLNNAVQESEAAHFPSFFAEYKFAVEPRTCIALVPNNPKGDRAYNALIRDVMRDVHCSVERVNEIFDSNSVLDEIWAHINTSELVIADLTGRDPDVFYLAGLAYGLKKHIIFIAENGTDIPFDLQAGSHLIYSLDPFADGIKARQALTKLVQTVIA